MLTPPSLRSTLLLSIFALHAGAAAAQTAAPLVSPNRADQNPPGVRRAQPAAPAAPVVRNPDAPITPFTLHAVEIAGSSLPAGELQPGYASFLGQTIDNPALSRLTDAVAAAYAKTDIALYTVLVPPQRFEGGVLRLIAVEGYVESVRFDGVDDPRLRRLLVRYFEPVVRSRPLKTSALQKALSLARDIPGLTIEPRLDRGGRQGAVRLVIAAKLRRVQGSLGFNNRGTALLGRDQVQVDGYANGLAFAGDQLHATIVAPSTTRLFQYYALSYAAPFDASGGTLQGNVSVLRTRPTQFPLKGDAISFGLQASRPLIRSFNRNLYLTASLTGVNSDNALFGSELSNERTRTARFAAAYTQSGQKNLLNISATASFGIDGLGARTFDREAQQTDFKKLNLKVLDNLLISRNVFLRFDGFAQATDDHLPPSEQVALGGDEFGRAYEAAIISGDYGVAGSAELAWSPVKRIPALLKGSEAYAFVDAGRTFYRGRFGQKTTQSDVASLGGGFRAQVKQRFVLQLEAAKGLTNPVFYEDRRPWRLQISVRTLF